MVAAASRQRSVAVGIPRNMDKLDEGDGSALLRW
jgi:hypothetical protein